ncbi:MAG: ATP-binding protein [Candidatus Omnitrophica bacterium]|nr:ATP-binding protein [Candidatus Omnitrophota bacterium]
MDQIRSLKARMERLERLRSEKALAEERLKKEESFLSSVFFSIQDGISVLDKDMNIVLVNPTMEHWYSHAMPLVGKKCYTAYHSRRTPCEVCPTRRTLREGGAARQIVPRRGTGGKITGWLDLYSFPLIDAKTKKIIGAIEYVRDITDKRIAEAKIKELLMRLVAVIEHIDEGITLTDSQGHFVIYNSKMGDLTGYSVEEANSFKDFMIKLIPDTEGRDKVRESAEKALENGGVHESEVLIKAKDGTEKTLLISNSLTRHSDEKMLLSVYRDISRYKELDRLKDDFISMVSHELRTPLSIIKEGINIIIDEIPGKINEQQVKILASAKANVERLSRIINDLLDISKIEAGRLDISREKTSLEGLIKQVLGYFENKIKGKGLATGTNFPKEGSDVYADAERITQVVTNLLDNAVKFTDKGRIDITIRRSGRMIECAISDTGIGISRENLPKLFTKFQQFERARRPGDRGTGLGLSIAKKIVEMHGGKIWVESDSGKGTKVTFTLPRSS